VWCTIGVILSLVLSIFIFGIPIALAFIGSVRILSHIEGRIVEGLLGVRMPRRLPAPSSADQKLWSRIKEALSDSRTWSSLFYLLLMSTLGGIYFGIAIAGIAIPVVFIGVGLEGLISGHSLVHAGGVPWLEHLFGTAPGLVLCMLIGVLFIFLTLHLAKGIGWVHGRIAELLLVRL
jgi:ABC-type multidrug transport system fused ATPase/permease subunit